MQLVVPSAVTKAVTAATTTFTAMSTILFHFISFPPLRLFHFSFFIYISHYSLLISHLKRCARRRYRLITIAEVVVVVVRASALVLTTILRSSALAVAGLAAGERLHHRLGL